MKRKEIIEQAKIDLQEAYVNAMNQETPEQASEVFALAISAFAQTVQEDITQDIQGVVDSQNTAVLQSRGAHVLTPTENTFYEKWIGAMTSNTPQQSVDLIDEVLPLTVVDRIFEDIQTAHPLLQRIRFQNTGALTRWLLSESNGVAIWGELTGTITSELGAEFSFEDFKLDKLSAFIPIAKAMLDLGPAWLDRYVRTILAEALAVGLETGIVIGDGKFGPIGMARKLSGATDGVYPMKTPISVTDLSKRGIGTLIRSLKQKPNGKIRTISDLTLIVNPLDREVLIDPATSLMNVAGSEVSVFPGTIIESVPVPEGFAILGIPSQYWAGVGIGVGGRLEYSDEYKFLEDLRIYLIKMYGRGRAMDENCFLYLDISDVQPAYITVKNIEEAQG
jgi:hypothetical protein